LDIHVRKNSRRCPGGHTVRRRSVCVACCVGGGGVQASVTAAGPPPVGQACLSVRAEVATLLYCSYWPSIVKTSETTSRPFTVAVTRQGHTAMTCCAVLLAWDRCLPLNRVNLCAAAYTAITIPIKVSTAVNRAKNKGWKMIRIRCGVRTC